MLRQHENVKVGKSKSIIRIRIIKKSSSARPFFQQEEEKEREFGRRGERLRFAVKTAIRSRRGGKLVAVFPFFFFPGFFFSPR